MYVSSKSCTLSLERFRKCQFLVQKNFKRKLEKKKKYKMFYYVLGFPEHQIFISQWMEVNNWICLQMVLVVNEFHPSHYRYLAIYLKKYQPATAPDS